MKRKRTVVKRVLQAIGKYKIWLAASLVLALLTVALTLYAPILVGDAIDYIPGPGMWNLRPYVPCWHGLPSLSGLHPCSSGP